MVEMELVTQPMNVMKEMVTFPEHVLKDMEFAVSVSYVQK